MTIGSSLFSEAKKLTNLLPDITYNNAHLCHGSRRFCQIGWRRKQIDVNDFDNSTYPFHPSFLPTMRSENEELKTAGLKVTLPRIRILGILENSSKKSRHLSAEDVYKELLDAGEDVGIATVYRVLTQFENAGLVDKHNFETGHSVFELSRGAHHDHMVCIDTGEIIEFTDDSIEERQREIAERHGYELEDHSLVLYVRKKAP